jgi:quercetin dioxygenase-like cupin family protein
MFARVVRGRKSVAVLAAGLGAVLITGGTALATFGSHTSATVLAEGSLGDHVNVRSKGVRLGIGASTEVRTITQSWEPGGYSGWHSHPGPVIFVLKSGSLSIYDEKCQPRVLKAGEAFVETPNALMNVRNESSRPATAYLTILSPAGALPKQDGPQPTPSCRVP